MIRAGTRGRRLAARAGAALFAFALSGTPGCATCISQAGYCNGSAPDNMWDPDAVIYGGTRIWIGAIANGCQSWDQDPVASAVFACVGLVDLPLSFVADTVLLPITLIEHAAR